MSLTLRVVLTFPSFSICNWIYLHGYDNIGLITQWLEPVLFYDIQGHLHAKAVSIFIKNLQSRNVRHVVLCNSQAHPDST